MKKKLLILSVPFIFSTTLSTNLVSASIIDTFSSTINQQENSSEESVLTDTLTRGASKPSNSAPIHDISINPYNYQITKIGYEVFTDKWIKGKTSMSVSLKNFKILNNYGGTSNQVTVTIYSSSGKVASYTFKNLTSATATYKFTSLNASTKYYVKFSVPNNGNTYSFNGSLS